MTVKDLVYRADEQFGDETFVREIAKKELSDTSFRMFRRRCDSLAVWIQNRLPQRSHIVLIGTTSRDYLIAWFGIQCANCVTVPLDCGNSAEKLADEINRSDSVMIFLDKRHEDDIEYLRQNCPQVTDIFRLEELDNIPDVESIPNGAPNESDLAAILFTSGTTGRSKGVMLSHGNLMDNTTCEPDLGYRGQKRMTVLPPHHVFCFTCDILCALWYGRILCVNDSLMRIVKNLKLFRPTDVTFVPMIAASILSKMEQDAAKGLDRRSVGIETFGEEFSVIYTGGAYLSPEIIDGYRKFGIEIAQGYGMTECSPRICTGVKNCPSPTSVGRIVPGCQVKIVDNEIWVKSPSVMQGYYNDPAETANTLTPDGWLKTGDLGYIDGDGYVYITGRKKNLIILSNGENVSPEELENQFACFAPVKEIIVSDRNGVLTAEVYADPDYVCDDIRAEIQGKIDSVNNGFPPAKRIAALVLREEEFPKTASKKIIRKNIN